MSLSELAQKKENNRKRYELQYKDKEKAERKLLFIPETPEELKKYVQNPDAEIHIKSSLNLSNLATLIGTKKEIVVEVLKRSGFEDIDQNKIPPEIAELIVMEFGMKAKVTLPEDQDLKRRPTPKEHELKPRPPIVTVMGHVDHGKTTLLDYLRKTTVAAHEAGGITQHIGAFLVDVNSGGTKQKITFMDTPGHKAFGSMRARGASVTDLVVLVVAADDGVMSQTIEAIQHAKKANVPLIVAINKCDKPTRNLKKIKDELLRYEVQLEELGGETQAVEISALKGTNVNLLMESIMAQAEFLNFRADYSGPVEGLVIESKMDKHKGPVATVIIQRGTLTPGKMIVAGTAMAKVRNISNNQSKQLDSVTPGIPVEITGWRELPNAGDVAIEAPSEERAKIAIEWRVEKKKTEELLQNSKLILKRQVLSLKENDEEKEFRLKQKRGQISLNQKFVRKEYNSNESEKSFVGIIKGDVSGTVEALENELNLLKNDVMFFDVVKTGLGPVSESEVDLAESTNGIIIAFNVGISKEAEKLAKMKNVTIVQNKIIYHIIDSVKQLMSKRLPKTTVRKVQGKAIAQQIFNITSKGKTIFVAGCRVTDGVLLRNSKYSIERGGVEVFVGEAESLKHNKEDKTKIEKGVECGLSLSGYSEIQKDDVIICFEDQEVEAEFTPSN